MTSEHRPEKLIAGYLYWRVPNLEEESRERAACILRGIDEQRKILGEIVGPEIGSKLLQGLITGGLSEYNRENLGSASRNVLRLTFSPPLLGVLRNQLVTEEQMERDSGSWKELEKNYPPYASEISLIREIIKKFPLPRKQFYFTAHVSSSYGKAVDLLALFLNARGLYPEPAIADTDYQGESDEIIKSLNLVNVENNRKKSVITPEEVIGFYLAGTLKTDRQVPTYHSTFLNTLGLPRRVFNAFNHPGIDTLGELEWLLQPENKKVLEGFRNIGQKSLDLVKESLKYHQGILID
ncbi:MAG: DNA-directed RNA polymerase subunit alpha C-terminal domain-containing protein [Candidatus Daviesbacteria bacterium]|nr:DNA-directed RNA polymerase subunit alpha C-terminal domain-containing protein [Candidatus Daviesbacteria bacterium]